MSDQETPVPASEQEPDTQPAQTREFGETRKGIEVLPSVSVEPSETPPMALLPDLAPTDSVGDVGSDAIAAPSSSQGNEGEGSSSE